MPSIVAAKIATGAVEFADRRLETPLVVDPRFARVGEAQRIGTRHLVRREDDLARAQMAPHRRVLEKPARAEERPAHNGQEEEQPEGRQPPDRARGGHVHAAMLAESGAPVAAFGPVDGGFLAMRG
jgi:hypothetical protein